MPTAMTGEPTIAATPTAQPTAEPTAQSDTVQSNRAEPKDTPKLPLTPEAFLPEVRVLGTVKFFNDEQGYGFICRDDGEKDCYVHHSSIVSASRRKTLANGQRVEFSPAKGPKGPVAKRVIPID